MSSQHYNWSNWNADWKVWWGEVLGNNNLTQAGLDQKQSLKNNRGGTPLVKSKSLEDTAAIGVNGGRVSESIFQKPSLTRNHNIPGVTIADWKHPSFERNKVVYDNDLASRWVDCTIANQFSCAKSSAINDNVCVDEWFADIHNLSLINGATMS
eukprot:gene12472-14632_t